MKDIESSGLKIEVQIRTRIQHIWATTVETLDTFLGLSMKSSEGPTDILEFLSLTSSAFALLEKSPIVPEHSFYSKEELFKTVLDKYELLDIERKLKGFTVAAGHIDKSFSKKKFDYYLII